MTERDVTSLRTTLEFLKEEGELLIIDGEVDPYLEVTGITKALDNSHVLLFQNVKGYTGKRIMAGLFSRTDRVARIFGVGDGRKLKLKCLEAIQNPIAPRIVESGPCQEMVQTKKLDILKSIPITQHTESDPGRILSGGIALIRDPNFGSCISYKRMHFRGRDWGSVYCAPGSHATHILSEYASKSRNLPITINICPDPAVMGVAGGGMVQDLPVGTDELAIAGGLQGTPINICHAKTVDTYAIATSEWVIEGYIDTSQVVWESAEAEKAGDDKVPFFPEYHGFLGSAATTYKFQATAITGRKDNPIYYSPLGHSFESPHMKSFNVIPLEYSLLQSRWPNLIRDVNVLPAMKGRFGLAIQVEKQNEHDDYCIKDIIQAAIEYTRQMRFVVVVDEDVDIYSAEEIIWALIFRMDAKDGLILVPPIEGSIGMRKEKIGPFVPVTRMGFDATVPIRNKWAYLRGKYPEVNLEKWLTREQIKKARALQCDYAKLLAKERV
ncbi:UbiD family decarboxylase domain-containing protein [Chloroflexota bacterium]